MASTIKKETFGRLSGGESADLYTLSNKHGMSAKITNFGGIVVSLHVADKLGQFDDVVLGFDNISSYETLSPYFGALIGPYGNRIADAQFSLDGENFVLEKNDGNNCLHGGLKGFDKVLWQAQAGELKGEPVLELSYLRPHGESGFPGKLEVRAIYRLSDNNELITEFRAVTDQPTHVNFTQHSYFNLLGKGDVCQHELQIDADYYLPVNENLIPVGEEESVENSAFDFRRSKGIGQDIAQDSLQLLRVNGGYDHTFVLNKKSGDSFQRAARVVEAISGRVLEVHTTEPGIQFYSANFLDGTLQGKGGQVYGKHGGFCLEPQHFPDSPNQGHFPSTLLRPGEEFQSRMSFKFSTL